MFTTDYKLNRLSAKRSIIMGIAMLWIVFFHSSISTDNMPILHYLKQMGDIGVDIFLFVSGIGIYYSLQKHESIKSYLISRLSRILPAFLLINTFWFIIHDLIVYKTGLINFVKNITTLSFWLDGNLTTWYLSSILVLQLVAPLLIKLLNRWESRVCILICIFVLCIVFFIRFTQFNEVIGHLLIWICRIPIYVVGLWCGKYVQNNKSLRLPVPVLAVIAAGCVIITLGTLGFLPIYIPFVIKYIAYWPLSIILTVLFTFIPNMRVLTWIGMHSLEIYLIHEKILFVFSNMVRIVAPRMSGALWCNMGINVFALFVALLSAAILKNFCNSIMKRV